MILTRRLLTPLFMVLLFAPFAIGSDLNVPGHELAAFGAAQATVLEATKYALLSPNTDPGVIYGRRFRDVGEIYNHSKAICNSTLDSIILKLSVDETTFNYAGMLQSAADKMQKDSEELNEMTWESTNQQVANGKKLLEWAMKHTDGITEAVKKIWEIYIQYKRKPDVENLKIQLEKYRLPEYESVFEEAKQKRSLLGS